jgi:hypothetical protein
LSVSCSNSDLGLTAVIRQYDGNWLIYRFEKLAINQKS